MTVREFKYNFIYKTTNIVNGKIYIGRHSTDNNTDLYLGSGVLLLEDIKKYGVDNFRREILEYCDKVDLCSIEKDWIRRLKSNEPSIGYNGRISSSGGPVTHHSIDSKNKISKSKKGQNAGELSNLWGKDRRGDENPNFGNKLSDEAKKRISLLLMVLFLTLQGHK